jgi:hypothetical protein
VSIFLSRSFSYFDPCPISTTARDETAEPALDGVELNVVVQQPLHNGPMRWVGSAYTRYPWISKGQGTLYLRNDPQAMDPLSISASIIALLQATTTVISICYDFRACIKNIPWSLTRVIDEVKSLRNVLETLEELSQSHLNTDVKRRPVFELLCDQENGPLVSCERELGHLEEKVMGKGWVEKVGGVVGGKDRGKRQAFMKAMGWRLKDGDARECLDRIERCKNTLSLAISADAA